MALKNLIKNQIIIIDDHKRGAAEIKNFDNLENDVHIDKKTNFRINGKRRSIKIKIPINSENPIKVESGKKLINIPTKLKKEIKKAFENSKIRNAFIGDVIEILSDYESNLRSEKQVEKVLERLSKHFDLEWDMEIIKKYRGEILESYTQFYKDDSGHSYFIKLDKRRITIAENNGYTKQFKRYNP